MATKKTTSKTTTKTTRATAAPKSIKATKTKTLAKAPITKAVPTKIVKDVPTPTSKSKKQIALFPPHTRTLTAEGWKRNVAKRKQVRMSKISKSKAK